jgi:hypothetical protein
MKRHDEQLHNLYRPADIFRIMRGRDVNCWVIWPNVSLDVHTELLEILYWNEQSTPHLGAHI